MSDIGGGRRLPAAIRQPRQLTGTALDPAAEIREFADHGCDSFGRGPVLRISAV